MTMRPAGLAAFALLLVTPALHAQPLGVGVRAGTMGIGGELALDLSRALVLRGGIGYALLEPTVRMNDIDWTLELPSPWYNVGVDAYLNRALRVGAGVLFKSEDARLDAVLDGPVTVGGRQFSPAELGSLIGTADSGSRRPYVLMGFGRHTRGSGLFLDLGMVWLGETDFLLESDGGTFGDPTELDMRLRDGEADIESDLGAYLKFWPYLSIGARLAIQ